MDKGNMTIRITESADYRTGTWYFGGRFQQAIRVFEDDKPDDYVPDLTFSVYAQKGLPQGIFPRLDVGFNYGSAAAPTVNMDHRGDYYGISKEQFKRNLMNLTVNPQVDINIGRFCMTPGWSMHMILTKDARPTATYATISHALFIDFRIYF
jgi:hypothetical protein